MQAEAQSKTSRLPGFYKLSIEDRQRIVEQFSNLKSDSMEVLRKEGNLPLKTATLMSENVVGTMSLPFSVAPNFLINNRNYLIPMVIEEPSVVAAVSNAAKQCRETGGIIASSRPEQYTVAQIQFPRVKDEANFRTKILKTMSSIMELADEQSDTLRELGGGVKGMEMNRICTRRGDMYIVELMIDTKDSMGANVANKMAEAVAPYIQQLTGERPLLRILTNLSDRKVMSARATFKNSTVGGDSVIEDFLDAIAFADSNPYRAATNNKGIMNGIIAAAQATCQDTRAIEAAAHAYAAKGGRYKSLCAWEKDDNGDLVGTISVPVPVGTVGRILNNHPVAKMALEILDVKSAREHGEILASVGLMSNFAAVRALISEGGINGGHMKLADQLRTSS